MAGEMTVPLTAAKWGEVLLPLLDWSQTTGQRLEIHDYPGMDESTVQYYGRAHRTWRLTVVYAGPNWRQELETLLAAVETPFAWDLHLPDGTICAAVAEPCEYTVTSHGEARVQLTLHEVSEPIEIERVADAVSELRTSLEAAQKSTWQAFRDKVAAGYRDTTRALQQYGAAIADLRAEILEWTSPALILDAIKALESLESEVSRLITTPLALYDAWQATLSGLMHPVGLEAAIGAYRRRLSAAREVKDDQGAATWVAMCAPALTVWVPYVCEKAYASYQDGQAALRLLSETLLDVEADSAAYAKTRSLAARILIMRVLDLPRLYKACIQAPTPARVLAYRLYGEPERGMEIVTRNALYHPAFVSGHIWLAEH